VLREVRGGIFQFDQRNFEMLHNSRMFHLVCPQAGLGRFGDQDAALNAPVSVSSVKGALLDPG
jgi:hypothetical protein